MFSIAALLDSAKEKAGICSDYRLAKTLGITHVSISNYRSGKSMPDEVAIERLCKLTGDDPDIISAQLQSRRARTEEGRVLWERIAHRLMLASPGHKGLCFSRSALRLLSLVFGVPTPPFGPMN